jgi:hypothetical protein
MSSVEAALTAIESLEHGEKFVYTQIAGEHHVDRRMLLQRH